MSFATRKAVRLRERMSPRKATILPTMPAPDPAARISSIARLHERMTQLQKDRSSQGHLRQTMIMTPRALQWWEKEVVEYAFSHPHVRNRLERLMGSNVTRLTDREFMLRLAERIQEEHVAQMQKRIRAREEAEVEREKKLILEGKIPVEQVPRELAEHPVFKISRITSEAIEYRRSKVQHPTTRLSYIPEGTLSALAKAMAPEGEDMEEDEKERLEAMHEAQEDFEEELERVEEVEEEEEEEGERAAEEAVEEVVEEAVQEGEVAKVEEEHKELRESLKKDIEERVEKEEEKRELKGVLKKGSKTDAGRGSFIKIGLDKKVSLIAMEGGPEEGKEGGEGKSEGEEEVKEVAEPEPDDYFDDDDDQLDDDGDAEPLPGGPDVDQEDHKRTAVHRHSQRQKEHRRKRLASKSGVPAFAEDGRPLSPDEVERERVNLERTSMMAAARNEWQAEIEMAEQLARERDKNYLLSETELRRLRYEAPLIEELRKQETVADLYRLADEIVGGLWIKQKPGK